MNRLPTDQFIAEIAGQKREVNLEGNSKNKDCRKAVFVLKEFCYYKFIMAILVEANAKINLELKILGKRNDGYHQIEGIYQSIDVSDFLFFEKVERDVFLGAINCPSSEEIILKSKQVLEKSLGKKLPCLIHLHKAIPIAAGMGGGSADAAATLLGLNKLYQLSLSREKLAEIGLKIGTDVVFLLYGGTCKVKGIGEKITPIEKNVSPFFIIFRPHKRLESKKMFQLYDETGKSFFELAKEICPDTGILEEKIKKFPIKEFGLSGKGPTVFCGVSDYKSAEKIASCWPEFNGDIFICQPTKKAIHITNL
ncbi:MAG: 4-(cytidine 5'-diphospho)-2-C-methyl-D-erythritol kinase [Parcubacteria group bacterium]